MESITDKIRAFHECPEAVILNLSTYRSRQILRLNSKWLILDSDEWAEPTVITFCPYCGAKLSNEHAILKDWQGEKVPAGKHVTDSLLPTEGQSQNAVRRNYRRGYTEGDPRGRYED